MGRGRDDGLGVRAAGEVEVGGLGDGFDLGAEEVSLDVGIGRLGRGSMALDGLVGVRGILEDGHDEGVGMEEPETLVRGEHVQDLVGEEAESAVAHVHVVQPREVGDAGQELGELVLGEPEQCEVPDLVQLAGEVGETVVGQEEADRWLDRWVVAGSLCKTVPGFEEVAFQGPGNASRELVEA